jgi:hypothetical protein
VNIVYYSLVVTPVATCQWQWIQSIKSLRLYNRTIPVYLFIYGAVDSQVLVEADRHNVRLVQLGAYSGCFRGVAGNRAAALSSYPTLHKFLSLASLPPKAPSQILFLDCDTYFFGNVDNLFSHYHTCQWYAREEPFSQRSTFGYDPGRLDETMLAQLFQAENLTPVAPYNSGVCILNHGIWKELVDLRDDFLNYAWRLMVGIHQDQHPRAKLTEMQAELVEESATELDRKSALRYPSSNFWILDQVALWLTLGKIPSFSHDYLSKKDAIQNGEYSDTSPSTRRIVAHYYSVCQDEFFSKYPIL